MRTLPVRRETHRRARAAAGAALHATARRGAVRSVYGCTCSCNSSSLDVETRESRRSGTVVGTDAIITHPQDTNSRKVP